MIGSLFFTFLGMGLLGYLEQRGKGIAEGRLAAAYALAGALTILFMVFNPAGQIEVLNLLKGEVIALSKAELSLLVGGVLRGVWSSMLIYFAANFSSLPSTSDLAFFAERSPGRLGYLALSSRRLDYRLRRDYGGTAADFRFFGASGAGRKTVG